MGSDTSTLWTTWPIILTASQVDVERTMGILSNVLFLVILENVVWSLMAKCNLVLSAFHLPTQKEQGRENERLSPSLLIGSLCGGEGEMKDPVI